jgi:hypothetical protein
MRYSEVPVHPDAMVPVLEKFTELPPGDCIKGILPLSMEGKTGETIKVQYLSSADREKNEHGHRGEVFCGILCSRSMNYPLPYGSVLKFVVGERRTNPVMDMVQLADVLLECAEPFDLREALDEIEQSRKEHENDYSKLEDCDCNESDCNECGDK